MNRRTLLQSTAQTLGAIALPSLPLGLASCASDGTSSGAALGNKASGVANSSAPLAQRMTMAVMKTLPQGWVLRNVFDVYEANPAIRSAWARNWTKAARFTGVAWNCPQGGSLISPQHFVIARHAPAARGTEMMYHDENGNAHVRKIARLQPARGASHPDIGVGLLDRPLPDTVKPYRLLPPRADYHTRLPGALVMPTQQQRRVAVAVVKLAERGSLVLRHDEAISKHVQSAIQGGDSGHPTFGLVDGETVLLSTHTYGGAGSGPLFSDPYNFQAIQQSMGELGGPAYTLQTADVKV